MTIEPSRSRPWHRAIEQTLGAAARHTVDVPGREQAAVLLLLYERDGEPWVVLTKRTDTVRTHKGEISFPGGARDPEDPDLWTTAVRETVEELGVDPDGVRQLGALDDFPTFSSGYVVSPFVAAFDGTPEWHPSEHEIAEVIELPLRRLAEAHRAEYWERHGARRPMHLFEVDGNTVWGLTAFILRGFLDLVGPALGYEEARDAHG